MSKVLPLVVFVLAILAQTSDCAIQSSHSKTVTALNPTRRALRSLARKMSVVNAKLISGQRRSLQGAKADIDNLNGIIHGMSVSIDDLAATTPLLNTADLAQSISYLTNPNNTKYLVLIQGQNLPATV